LSIVPDDKQFVKAGHVILEGFQTLIDLPIMALSGILFVVAPYRAKLLCKKFKETPG
jgi:hypothetical protein